MQTVQQPIRRTALVTGASGGIGLELARILAANEHNLIIVGRKQEQLEAVAAELRHQHLVSVRCEGRDLARPRAAFELWTDLAASGVIVDVLVNNAGVGLYGAVDTQDPNQLERMVQLNVLTLTMLTRLALPGMRERRWGRILNVSSLAGYQPGAPWMAAYYATKSYVLSFSKGLARELDGSGVSVTALSPGPTISSFDDTAGASANVLYRRLPKMTAADVARAGYEGMMRQSIAVVPGIVTKVLALAGELPPRRIALEVNYWLWKLRG